MFSLIIGVVWRHICDDSIVLPSEMLDLPLRGMSATETANAGNIDTTEETTPEEDIPGEDTPEGDASKEDMPEESMLNAQLSGTEPPERGLSGTDLTQTGPQGIDRQLSCLQHLLPIEDDVLKSTEQTAAGSSLQLHRKIGTILGKILPVNFELCRYDGLSVAVKKAQSQGHSVSAEDRAEFERLRKVCKSKCWSATFGLKRLRNDH